ncbi:MAG: DMT family transporter [Sulfitobacter sp.]
MHNRKAGVVLVVISAFVFSTAGIFTKGVDVPAWDIIFWRGVAASGFTLTYLALRGELVNEMRQFKAAALGVTVLMAAGTAAFIPAFKLSSVANVSLIYGAVPFLAAVLAWIFLKELPSRKVATASLAAFAGVIVIFADSVGKIAFMGDALALFMTLAMAGTMVLYRAFPATTAAFPAALSSLVLLPFAYYSGAPFDVSMSDLPILMVFGLVFAVASVTLSEGARRLPPAETALLSVLEMPLAPMLALIVFQVMPSFQVIIGGGGILIAVLWSQTSQVPKKQPER